MARKQITNLPASVKSRLLAIAQARGDELQLVLLQYGVERLLYRMSQVTTGERFVLKGAVLFALWNESPQRPTRDVDFLGIGDSSTENLAVAFREICSAEVVPDGLIFPPDTVEVEAIRGGRTHGGVRVTLSAFLDKARIPIQADIGFGDSVFPSATVERFPTLLDFPAPTVRAYPPETVLAEKFEAMVSLGVANTRIKDFYDAWMLSETRDFDGPTVSAAISATFAHRGTPLPAMNPGSTPIALTSAFATDSRKAALWSAFRARIPNANAPDDLDAVIDRLARFFAPIANAAAAGGGMSARWVAGDGWTL